MDNEEYIKRCYGLAIQAGKKGFDTFGALLVHDGEILEEAENTADWEKGIFGHAEYNLVHKCANRYSDTVLKESTLYMSCAPCERCLCAIASLGVENVVFGVSYEAFSQLTPHDAAPLDREGLLRKLGVRMKLTGPVLEDEGMHVFEWWGGEYRPLNELIAEMTVIRKSREQMKSGDLKKAVVADAVLVAPLACALWPEHSLEEMIAEYKSLLSNNDAAVFLYKKDGQPVAFAQCQLRHNYVEGTQTCPVGYLEGIYVRPEERRRGIAHKLLSACESWVKEFGCSEIGSDCELTNLESQEFHRAVGFEEANRIVAYVRKI